MKILITEFMDEAAVARLKQHCPDTHYNPKWVDEPASLLAAAADCDVLVVRNRTQVRGDLLAAAKQVSLIGRLGVGLDNIDMVACQARQIKVVPASGANALAVAEYVIGTAMLLLRASYLSTPAVSAGKWPRNALSNGRETAGKTLALIGYGDIGQRTARLARGLGMQTVAFDPILPANSPAWAETTALSLEACLARADVVSLHVPYTEQTKNLLSRERLQSMKPGAVLINTARGGLIDEPALAELLKSGHLGGAAIDVFGTEPYPANPMWDGIANLVLTPHIAGVSSEANVRVSEMIADAVIAHAAAK
jgi:(S)-sulfolactate dehydrogenase